MKVYTVYEASKLCGVTAKTIANWIEAGHIKAFKTVGGHRRIEHGDLVAFMKEKGIPMPSDMESAGDSGENPGKRKILIVDDDRIIVETLVLALEEEDENYEILSAFDGFEAGIQLEKHKPDLVILDIMMPDIDGYEVCRHIKSSDDLLQTKVVILSAYLDDNSYRQMREYGADLCFSKPLPLDQLRAEVAGLLASPAAGDEN